MKRFKFNPLLLLFVFLFYSCAHSVNWSFDKVSFWSRGELKTYALIESKKGWVACDANEFAGKADREVKSYLKDIGDRNLTDEEQRICASYTCSNQKEYRCINQGSYAVFSEVVSDFIKQELDNKFVTSEDNMFNWELEEDLCLKDADLNSCAIVSNYYLYRAKNRKSFFKIRKKECELLAIKEADCNYDF